MYCNARQYLSMQLICPQKRPNAGLINAMPMPFVVIPVVFASLAIKVPRCGIRAWPAGQVTVTVGQNIFEACVETPSQHKVFTPHQLLLVYLFCGRTKRLKNVKKIFKKSQVEKCEN